MGVGLQPNTMMVSIAMLLMLLMVGAVKAKSKITPDQLKDVNKKTNLDRSKSFRCGIFFPDPKEANSSNPEWVPVGTLLVFNGSWTAPECPNPGDDGASRFSDFCDSIMKPFSDRLFLSDPSLVKKYADKGNSIGDDVFGCSRIRSLLRMWDQK